MRGSRNFRQGGGGGGVQVSVSKKALTFFLVFIVLSKFYRSQMVNFKEIYHFSKFQRRVQHFPGGGGGGGGIQLLISNITCDFPGGGGLDPLSPLWIRTWAHTFVEIDHEIISAVSHLPSANAFKKGCCPLQAKVCARITG